LRVDIDGDHVVARAPSAYSAALIVQSLSMMELSERRCAQSRLPPDTR
jgi:hypothetical protein